MLMKLIRYSLLACLIAFSLTSCDIVKEDKVCTECLAEGTGKKIFLEDFTGHQCSGCPRAHEKMDEFKALYGDNIVLVSIHAGGFAFPLPALGYTVDYTNEMGDDIYSHYENELESLPTGMVNRKRWDNGKVLQKFAAWGTQIAKVISETPDLGIELEAGLNDEGDAMDIEVDVTYFTEGAASHNLVVAITEDSIVSKQANSDSPDGYVEDYVHNHMLRGSVTQGSFGIPLKSATIVAGETFQRVFNHALNPDWDPAQLHVIAYVMDNVTKEVLQVEEVKLK